MSRALIRLRGTTPGDEHYIDLLEVHTINQVGDKVLVTSGHHAVTTIEPIGVILAALGATVFDCEKMLEMERQAQASKANKDAPPRPLEPGAIHYVRNYEF